MDVLVDYSNLDTALRRSGPKLVVDRILDTLVPHLSASNRVNVRLYDGWYQKQALTPRAQEVSAQVMANFPTTFPFVVAGEVAKVIVKVELAYTLLIAPSATLWHTHRMRDEPPRLTCADPVSVGCTATPCELTTTHRFLKDKKCPKESCEIDMAKLVKRSEQKLVDGMLAADLFFAHLQGWPAVAVVSSDDDMWPAIRTVLDLGVQVLHVHTLKGHRTPTFYERGTKSKYLELDLEGKS